MKRVINTNNHIMWIDFGLSAIKPVHEKLQDKDAIPGTPLWMPPEVMMGRQVDEKADVYSYGIVLWEIVTQQIPFPDMTSFPKFRQAVCLNNVRPPLTAVKVDSISTLLQQCWHKDPASRPSFEEIITILDDIMVDCAIKDLEGREFWKSQLPGKEFVPFDEFLPLFLAYTGIPQPDTVQLECMKLLVATEYRDNIMKPVEVVKIEDFGNLLENFGPIKLVRQKKDESEEVTIFKRVCSLVIVILLIIFCNNPISSIIDVSNL